MDKITCLLVGVALGVVINKQLECKRKCLADKEQFIREERYKKTCVLLPYKKPPCKNWWF